MFDKTFILTYLEKSLLLDTSSTTTDPAYASIVAELENIYSMSILAHNAKYDASNLPPNEIPFVILQAKIEVYYRLATATAPFYPIEAEGAKLRKDYRFEHYMSLIRRVNMDYSYAWDKFEREREVVVSDVVIQKSHYTRRNYSLAERPSVTLHAVNIGVDHVDINWTKFSAFSGLFYKYHVYVSEYPIYDEFEDITDSRAKLYMEVTDIHRTKCRVKGLTENTTYYVLVVSEDRNQLKGYSETSILTQSSVAP